MKKFKKAAIFITLLAVLTSCFCMSAQATKHNWAFKTENKYDSGKKYLNASPGNKTRFVATPKCNIKSATASYSLFACHWYGAELMPRTQTFGVGTQIRAWWRETNPGDYSVVIQPYGNQYSGSTLKASIDYPSAWLENFLDGLWDSY